MLKIFAKVLFDNHTIITRINKYNISYIQSTFIEQALFVWNRIEIEEKIDISIGEESLTDFNLQNLQMFNNKEIITKKFNKIEEGKNGADWEWWFISGKRGFGIRVQAKKLDIKKNIYPDIDRFIGKSKKKQMDVLIKESKINRLKLLPIYVFYSFFDISNNIKNNCGIFNIEEDSIGCSFVPAEVLKNKISNLSNVTPKSIEKFAYPWHCLFCNYQSNVCSNTINSNTPNNNSENTSLIQNNTSKKSLPDMVFNSISKKYSEELHLQNLKDQFVTDKLPSYVTKLANNDPLNEDDIKKIKTKIVTIIKEKDN